MKRGVLTHGSLFTGIGGFDLGFERAGIKTVWQVEIDPFCRKVLERHFPDARQYHNIKRVKRFASVDVISGGFPCQDISQAGRMRGIDGKRSGLWSEMWRVVRIVRPRYVVVENVAALLHRGIERVIGNLAEIGYDAEWDCLPAKAFGAPHERDRIFLVAYPARIQQGRQEQWAERERIGMGGEPVTVDDDSRDGCRSRRTRRSDSGGPRKSEQALLAYAYGSDGNGRSCAMQVGREWSQEETSDHDFGTGTQWSIEPDVGRVAHGIPARVDRLKGLGNAVVPQIAEWIGRRIVACHEQSKDSTAFIETESGQ